MPRIEAIKLGPRRTHTRAKQITHALNVPRILLADDQEEVRRTVASMLEDKFAIVGLAENGKEVLAMALSRSPDVLVLDIFMPVLNGIETAVQVKASGFPVKVIFLTVHEDLDFLDATMSVGALGYVLKAHLATDLIPAIQHVLEGRVYISPSMLSR